MAVKHKFHYSFPYGMRHSLSKLSQTITGSFFECGHYPNFKTGEHILEIFKFFETVRDNVTNVVNHCMKFFTKNIQTYSFRYPFHSHLSGGVQRIDGDTVN